MSTRTDVRVAQLAPPGGDGVAVGPGIWETSGIIDTDGLFGDGSWLFDVQAHTSNSLFGRDNVPNEDGQLLLLLPLDNDDDDEEDETTMRTID